jgi:hypothetical protein
MDDEHSGAFDPSDPFDCVSTDRLLLLGLL